jgi:hypothetical protein
MNSEKIGPMIMTAIDAMKAIDQSPPVTSRSFPTMRGETAPATAMPAKVSALEVPACLGATSAPTSHSGESASSECGAKAGGLDQQVVAQQHCRAEKGVERPSRCLTATPRRRTHAPAARRRFIDRQRIVGAICSCRSAI